MTAIATADGLEQALSEGFVLAIDGHWYPTGRGEPLVRLAVSPAGYQVQRRRKPGAPWMLLVSASREEFDASAFRTWRANWQMMAPA